MDPSGKSLQFPEDSQTPKIGGPSGGSSVLIIRKGFEKSNVDWSRWVRKGFNTFLQHFSKKEKRTLCRVFPSLSGCSLDAIVGCPPPALNSIWNCHLLISTKDLSRRNPFLLLVPPSKLHNYFFKRFWQSLKLKCPLTAVLSDIILYRIFSFVKRITPISPAEEFWSFHWKRFDEISMSPAPLKE